MLCAKEEKEEMSRPSAIETTASNAVATHISAMAGDPDRHAEDRRQQRHVGQVHAIRRDDRGVPAAQGEELTEAAARAQHGFHQLGPRCPWVIRQRT
jgi:hypothetical protein